MENTRPGTIWRFHPGWLRTSSTSWSGSWRSTTPTCWAQTNVLLFSLSESKRRRTRCGPSCAVSTSPRPTSTLSRAAPSKTALKWLLDARGTLMWYPVCLQLPAPRGSIFSTTNAASPVSASSEGSTASGITAPSPPCTESTPATERSLPSFWNLTSSMCRRETRRRTLVCSPIPSWSWICRSSPPSPKESPVTVRVSHSNEREFNKDMGWNLKPHKNAEGGEINSEIRSSVLIWMLFYFSFIFEHVSFITKRIPLSNCVDKSTTGMPWL